MMEWVSAIAGFAAGATLVVIRYEVRKMEERTRRAEEEWKVMRGRYHA